KTLLVVHDVAEHNLAKHLFVNGWVGDRNQCLNPSVKIAGHQIGRRYEYDGIIGRQAAAIAKAIDAAVLEEAPDDRLYPDVIRQTGHLRPQATDAAHDEVDFDPCPAGVVQRVDDDGID